MPYQFEISGQIGGPGPDGFTVVAKRETERIEAFVPVEDLRRFWAAAGRALADYDEAAGEPSSEPSA